MYVCFVTWFDKFVCFHKIKNIYIVCLICRPYVMGGTRVACIEQRWTGIWRGKRLLSFCPQERTEWWDPHKSCIVGKSQGSTRISHGQNSGSFHKSTTGLMLLPSTTSSHGNYLPNHPALLVLSLDQSLNWHGIAIYNYAFLFLFFFLKK